jgi:hypothetical protein
LYVFVLAFFVAPTANGRPRLSSGIGMCFDIKEVHWPLGLLLPRVTTKSNQSTFYTKTLPPYKSTRHPSTQPTPLISVELYPRPTLRTNQTNTVRLHRQTPSPSVSTLETDHTNDSHNAVPNNNTSRLHRFPPTSLFHPGPSRLRRAPPPCTEPQ